MTIPSSTASETSSDATVIVVGGGLAGLSLALGLVNTCCKVQVHVVEKQFDFTRTGATFGLQPNGLKALAELSLGIVEELKKVGLFLPMTGGIMLGWWNVRDALLERVKENPQITLHTGWLLQEIEDDTTGMSNTVKAAFLKRDTTGTPTIESSLCLRGSVLIGADGVNSMVRDHLKLTPAKETHVTMWRTRLYVMPKTSTTSGSDNQAQIKAADLLRPYLDIPVTPMGIRLRAKLNYVLFNFHQKLPGTMAIVVNCNQRDTPDHPTGTIPPGTSPQAYLEASAENDTELQEIRAILELCDKDGLHHPVEQKVIELPVEDGHGWGGKGRITLIGDAAHALRPASGQGGSMAFEDAVVLCRQLKNALQQNDKDNNYQAVEKALKEYENARLPRVRKMWDDQWERSERAYRNETMEPWSEEFKEWVFGGV